MEQTGQDDTRTEHSRPGIKTRIVENGIQLDLLYNDRSCHILV